jgi:hypothetical protein
MAQYFQDPLTPPKRDCTRKPGTVQNPGNLAIDRGRAIEANIAAADNDEMWRQKVRCPSSTNSSGTALRLCRALSAPPPTLIKIRPA